jgi:hypothetical protein
MWDKGNGVLTIPVISIRSWQVVWGKTIAMGLYHKKYTLFHPIISPLKKHAGYSMPGAGVDYAGWPERRICWRIISSCCCVKDIKLSAPTKISVRMETLFCIS